MWLTVRLAKDLDQDDHQAVQTGPGPVHVELNHWLDRTALDRGPFRDGPDRNGPDRGIQDRGGSHVESHAHL